MSSSSLNIKAKIHNMCLNLNKHPIIFTRIFETIKTPYELQQLIRNKKEIFEKVKSFKEEKNNQEQVIIELHTSKIRDDTVLYLKKCVEEFLRENNKTATIKVQNHQKEKRKSMRKKERRYVLKIGGVKELEKEKVDN